MNPQPSAAYRQPIRLPVTELVVEDIVLMIGMQRKILEYVRIDSAKMMFKALR